MMRRHLAPDSSQLSRAGLQGLSGSQPFNTPDCSGDWDSSKEHF